MMHMLEDQVSNQIEGLYEEAKTELENSAGPLSLSSWAALKEDFKEKTREILASIETKIGNVGLLPLKEIESIFKDLFAKVTKSTRDFMTKQIEILKIKGRSNRLALTGSRHDLRSDDEGGLGNHDQGRHISRDLPTDRIHPQRSDASNKLPPMAVATFMQWIKENKDDPHPSKEEKVLMAARTNLKVKQITNWFVNHRGKRPRPTGKSSSKFTRLVESRLKKH